MELMLQKILFPTVNLCSRDAMYYRAPEECAIVMSRGCMPLLAGKEVSFDTYFNSFSIGKWRKYTMAQDVNLELDLQGSVVVRTYSAREINGLLRTKLTGEHVIEAPERSKSTVPVTAEPMAQTVYFTIRALTEDAVLYGGGYKAQVDETEVQDVHIGVAICTFKREEHIARNIKELRENAIDNPDSPLHGKLDLFISDNAKTLPQELSSEHVHIYPNKNLGGAGGFTRAMIEAMKVRDRLGITHLLMMDDDVLVGHDSLLRTQAFLSVIKQEYAGAFIGGHMLKLNEMNMQSEAGLFFRRVTHVATKANYNLEEPTDIVRNEIEDPVNYLGWWYCCMPMAVVTETNLPLPIFIKRDDIEYGLRSGDTFIMLNGICVWHEEFDYKTSSYLQYYYFRNLPIMLSKHRPTVSPSDVWKFVENNVNNHLATYRYKEAELALIGIQDFLKGIDWLKAQDGELLHAEIMKLGYKKIPLEKLDRPFTYSTFAESIDTRERKRHKLIRKATLNGMLLPAKRDIVVDTYKPKPHLFLRARRVLNYEDYTKTGFITYRDHDANRAIKSLMKDVKKQFDANYKNVSNEYAKRFNELTNLEFWNHYLYEEGEAPVYKSILPEVHPLSTNRQIARFCNAALERSKAKASVWAPIIPNRVMFVVNNRRGFTCNPKYIARKLIENYGDALDLYWVTDYPAENAELRELGIKVVKNHSDEHKKLYRQTKVYVTNDSFPAWAAKREGQIWINTWHGALSYKHIGYDYIAPKSKVNDKMYRYENRQADYFIAGCEEFIRDTSESFHFDPDIFIKSGLPRNDIFFGDNEGIVEKVRKRYGVAENARIVMFAPTFRRGMHTSTYGLDFEMLTKALHDRFGGDWVVFFRNHGFVKESKKIAEDYVFDVTSYPDMNELMLAADALVSDYSSCMYDFSLQVKPCFVFGTDLRNYIENDRGFAVPMDEWPYPIAFTNEELAANIRAFNEADFASNLKNHYDRVGRFDKGTASELFAQIIGIYCGLEE